MIPKNNFLDYDLKKGDVIYKGAEGNIRSNDKTSEFNTFIETKVNEKNKEFMQIWSDLLPEVFDINPKEILILNPQQGKVYGYNSKNKVLASTDIEIDNKEDGPINAILDGPCTKLLLGRFRCARAANSQPVPQLLPIRNCTDDGLGDIPYLPTLSKRGNTGFIANITSINFGRV